MYGGRSSGAGTQATRGGPSWPQVVWLAALLDKYLHLISGAVSTLERLVGDEVLSFTVHRVPANFRAEI